MWTTECKNCGELTDCRCAICGHCGKEYDTEGDDDEGD